MISLVALLPTISAFFRNSFILLNVYYAAQVNTTTLQQIGVGSMIVGLLYIATGSAFLGALGQMIERQSGGGLFRGEKVEKARAVFLQLVFIPLALLVQLLVPKLLGPFVLDEDVKENVRLFSLFMIPAAVLYHLNSIQTRFLTVIGSISAQNATLGYQFMPFIASILGFLTHWRFLAFFNGDLNITVRTIALSTILG